MTIASGVLLYDGDCGFCTASARWLEARLGPFDGLKWPVVRPWHPDDEQRYGITPAEADLEIHWVDPSGGISGGADAVLAYGRTGAGIWPWLSRLLGLPLAVQLTRAGYRLIARNRHRLPGGTATCQVPPGSHTTA